MRPDLPRVYIDTETTSLAPAWPPHGRRMWEFTAVRVDARGAVEDSVTLLVEDVDLTHADPASLAMNGFWDRHPGYGGQSPAGATVCSEWTATRRVEAITRAAVVVASNPSFDVETIAATLWRNGLPAGWHYSPHDLKSVGIRLAGLPLTASTADVATALGIDPREYATHSSAGDVALLRAVDAAIGARAPQGGASRP